MFGYAIFGEHNENPVECYASHDSERLVAEDMAEIDVGAQFSILLQIGFIASTILFICGFCELVHDYVMSRPFTIGNWVVSIFCIALNEKLKSIVVPLAVTV